MVETGAERFLMGVRMHEAARRMVIASLPASLSPQDLRKRSHGFQPRGVSLLILIR